MEHAPRSTVVKQEHGGVQGPAELHGDGGEARGLRTEEHFLVGEAHSPEASEVEEERRGRRDILVAEELCEAKAS